MDVNQIYGGGGPVGEATRPMSYPNDSHEPPILSSAASRNLIRNAERIRVDVGALFNLTKTAHGRATEAYVYERERIIRWQLASMPLDKLKSASDGRLRLGAIEDDGIRTVAAATAAGRYRLESIDGVGATTSTKVLAAAEHVESALRKVTRVRFDVDRRPPEQTALLRELRHVADVRQQVDPFVGRLDALVGAIDIDIEAARLETQRVKRFFSGRRQTAHAAKAFERLAALLGRPDTGVLVEQTAFALNWLVTSENEIVDIWSDYLEHSVEYNGLLIEIGGLGPDADAAQGFLPDELVQRIKALELDTTLLNVSLRGYQSFGARFALVQERTILGDEMGLGKTVEALAMLCHLRTLGSTHFMVVCPASVMANWEHEIMRHTGLERTWRLHGMGRDRMVQQWARPGGVGITTFDTLRALPFPPLRPAAVVVDEAHYVKNPEALRTHAVRLWLANTDRSLLMTGTPMENRVEEFRTLVHHIRPEVAATVRTTDGVVGADAFRKAVAPIYLRRNQADVLDELPPKIETADWLSLEGPALDVYRGAVAERNFMAMRRAAFLTNRAEDSPKLTRLLEIAEEAVDNDRKVVVFSYFRDVIARVHSALGLLAAGSLTGSVAATDRQRLVDDFSARRGPAVLVSQIEAGGVGLNIQAASVVVLTEPQWKPSTEDQAISRCHRMGQVRPVEVHRLLTENSVDERMLVILAKKSALFADYVRRSALKDATPEAIDVTDDVSTTKVASQAEQERRIIELESRRLGIEA